MDPRSPFSFIILPEVIALNVARSMNVNRNAAIHEEAIIEQVVIITNSGDLPYHQLGTLRALHVIIISVAGNGDTNIGFEDANRVVVGCALFPVAKCHIPVGRMVWTIIAWDKTPCLRTNTVETIIVSGTGLERIVACILSNCILDESVM